MNKDKIKNFLNKISEQISEHFYSSDINERKMEEEFIGQFEKEFLKTIKKEWIKEQKGKKENKKNNDLKNQSPPVIFLKTEFTTSLNFNLFSFIVESFVHNSVKKVKEKYEPLILVQSYNYKAYHKKLFLEDIDFFFFKKHSWEITFSFSVQTKDYFKILNQLDCQEESELLKKEYQNKCQNKKVLL